MNTLEKVKKEKVKKEKAEKSVSSAATRVPSTADMKPKPRKKPTRINQDQLTIALDEEQAPTQHRLGSRTRAHPVGKDSNEEPVDDSVNGAVNGHQSGDSPLHALSESESIPGELVMLDPAEILPSLLPVRAKLTLEAQASFLETVRSHGIEVPATGVRLADGRVRLTDGEVRRQAASRLGLLLPVIVREESPEREIIGQLVANAQRHSLSVFEEAAQLGRALELLAAVLPPNRVTQAYLAERIGRNASYVSERLRIAEVITMELAARAEVSWDAVCVQDQRALYRIVREPDLDMRAARLSELVTGSAPSWAGPARIGKAPLPPTSSRVFWFNRYEDGRESLLFRPEALTSADEKKLLAALRDRIRQGRKRAAGSDGAYAKGG